MNSAELYGSPNAGPFWNAGVGLLMEVRARRLGVPIYLVESYLCGDKKVKEEAIRLMREYRKANK